VRLGVADTYGESATADELLAKHDLDAAAIAARVLAIEGKAKG
jgi:transketolase C-terminal domain/subunit